MAKKEWPVVRLGDVLTPCGKPERITDTAHETFLTVKLRAQGVIKREIGVGKTPAPFTGYRVSAGQFIYSRIDARNGAFALIPKELEGAVVSKDFPLFEIDAQQCLPDYLLWYAKSGILANHAKALSFGATNRQRVKEESFLDFTIPLPPLDEQQRIAEILNEVQSGHQYLHSVGRRLDELRTSLIEASLPAAINTEVGDLIMGISSGSSLKCESEPAIGDEYGILKLSAVTSGEFKPNENKRFAGDPALITKNIVKPGDVLMTRKNTPELVGAVCRVTKEVGNLALPDLVYRIDLDTSKISAEVFQGIMMVPAIRERVRSIAGGSSKSMSNISQSRLRQLEIPVPSLDIQKYLFVLLMSIDKLKEQLELKTRLVTELQSSLTTRAFQGEL